MTDSSRTQAHRATDAQESRAIFRRSKSSGYDIQRAKDEG